VQLPWANATQARLMHILWPVRLMKEYDAMMGAVVLTQPDRVLHFLHGLDEVRLGTALGS